MTVLANARRMAEATPDHRNRYVDLLRAVSIVAVVIGHWLVAAPYISGGEIEGINLLAHSPWTQWLTWLFQVMPVFFMVGGYSNTTSWSSATARGQGYGTWLVARLRRLILPVAPLVAVWAVLGVVLTRASIDADLLRLGSQAALIPVWFLAVYVLVVVATPLLTQAWDRWGWSALGVFAALAFLVDLGAHAMPLIGWLNFGFVWAGISLVGTAWHRGRIGGSRSLPLAALAAAILGVLVSVGSYPISMVGVPGAVETNNSPPTVALMMFGLVQIAVLLTLETPARRALARVRLWTGTVLVNGLIMTLYLWHLTAMVLLIGGSLMLGGFGFHLEPGSGMWWMSRPLWLLAVSVATVPFLVMFRRFDRVTPLSPEAEVSPRVAIVTAAAACVGLALLAGGGIEGAFLGIRIEAVLLPLGAVWALRRAGAANPPRRDVTATI